MTALIFLFFRLSAKVRYTVSRYEFDYRFRSE